LSTADAVLPASPARHRLLFLIAICVGSLLLFLVQPMIARMTLPRLGGAPAVWNSAMLVYQALLLAGYAYAHWLGRFAPRRQAMIHLGLFCVAALMLPIGLSAATPGANASPVLWVPWLLLTSIGPLFFVVSAQAPLIQRWFALSGGGDPYPLYAASNLGSFAGLLAYPLAVEPFLKVGQQSLLWSVGYGLVALLTLSCALRLPRGIAATTVQAARTPPPDRRTLLRWIGLAAIPSGLMLSTTLHLTTDIVAMPLIWVIPLGLYLLSFSLAFAEKRTAANLMSLIAPPLLLITACVAFSGATNAPWVVMVLVVVTLFVVSVALHARMFDTRPEPEHLTGFYLAMSLGGVIGGAFCALLAPVIFDWTYEYPILLIAAALALAHQPVFRSAAWFWSEPKRRRLGTIAVLAIAIPATIVATGAVVDINERAPSLIGIGLVLLGALCLGHRLLFPAVLTLCMLAVNGWVTLSRSLQEGQMSRSYFGVYWVRRTDDKAVFLIHGTTIHGIQMLGERGERETFPTSYFGPKSGIGMAMNAAPALFGQDARISILGLGAGALVCYAKPEQRWKFYEIDPLVEQIARDERHFTYISRCRPDLEIEIGDARLTIADEPAHRADILAMDAFSSDMVPMHLLTLEAFETYRRYITPDGLLMVHISNRYLDFKPVLATAARAGWTARLREHREVSDEEAKLHYVPSFWVAMSPNPATIAALERESGADNWKPLPAAPDFEPWTDDHGSILPLLKIN
jgi:hypothetical protein